MKNYKAKEDITLNPSIFFDEEIHSLLLKKIRLNLKNSYMFGIYDSIFYNLLRNKPLFKGAEKIRTDKYYSFRWGKGGGYFPNRDYYLTLLDEIIPNNKEENKKKMLEVEKQLFSLIINNYKPEGF